MLKCSFTVLLCQSYLQCATASILFVCMCVLCFDQALESVSVCCCVIEPVHDRQFVFVRTCVHAHVRVSVRFCVLCACPSVSLSSWRALMPHSCSKPRHAKGRRADPAQGAANQNQSYKPRKGLHSSHDLQQQVQSTRRR